MARASPLQLFMWNMRLATVQLASREPLFRDIDAILRAPSAITRAEAPDLSALRAELREDVASADGGGFTITRSDRPIAILTHLRMIGTRDRHTTFAAKRDFFDLGATGIRFMRRCVLAEFAKYPSDRFVATRTVADRAACRWFKAIGMTRELSPIKFAGGLDHV